MRILRGAPLGLVGLFILGCSSSERPPTPGEAVAPEAPVAASPKLNPSLAAASHASVEELRSLSSAFNIGFDATGEPLFKVFYEVPLGWGDVATPSANVRPMSSRGRIRTANANRAGLAELAANPGVIRMELGRRMGLLNEVGASDSSVQTADGTTAFSFATTGTPAPIVVPFTPLTAGQKVTIKMAKGGAPTISGAGLTMTSTLKICADSACATVLAQATGNDGGNDARVTFTFPAKITYYIQCSANIGAGQTGPFPFALTYIGDSQNGYSVGSKARTTGKDGTGVIVGMVDTGIDFCHPDFIDPITKKTRIKYLWDQSQTPSGTLKSPPEFPGYGVEYTEADINATLATCSAATQTPVTTTDTLAHGTHTTGTAAGNGQGTKDPTNWPAGTFAGAAPKADIIMVNSFDADPNNKHQPPDQATTGLYSWDEGVEYVHIRAKQLGEPVVQSNSWGGWGGPQDGTGFEEQYLSAVAGAGDIPVFAAGNVGTDRIRAFSPPTIPAVGTTDNFRLQMLGCGPQANDAGSAGTCNPRYFDLWVDGKDSYTITLTAPDNSTFTWDTTALSLTTPTNGTVEGNTIAGVGDTAPEANGLKEEFLNIPPATSVPAAGEYWTVALTRKTGSSGSGKWDLYLGGGQNEAVLAADAVGAAATDTHIKRTFEPNGARYWYYSTVTEPATGFGILAVGATTANVRFYDDVAQSDEPYDTTWLFPDLGNFTYFSSRGPTRDGRAYPQITAPGAWVISTLSRYNKDFAPSTVHKDGMHAAVSGTSMATPAVAGAIALMLQQDPTNFPRPLVINTATHDAITNETVAGIQSQGWNGAGRINAAAAIKAVATDVAPTASNLKVTPSHGLPGDSVTFSVTASDSDGTVAEYLWDVNGDGYTDLFTTTNSVAYVIPQGSLAKSYPAIVTVADNYGRTAKANGTWTVDSPPDAGADGSTDGSTGSDGGDSGTNSGGDAGKTDGGDGGTIIGTSDGGDAGSIDGASDATVEDGSTPEASTGDDGSTPTPDATSPTPDATAPTPDATAPTPDAGSPKPDASQPSVDSGEEDAAGDGGTGNVNGGGGCGCKTAGSSSTSDSRAGLLSALGVAAVVVRSRRRRKLSDAAKK